MAGYSGTALPRKLGIKDGHRLALFGAPAHFDATLGELPEGVSVQDGLSGTAPLDVLVCFVTRRAQLERQLTAMRERMAPAAGL